MITLERIVSPYSRAADNLIFEQELLKESRMCLFTHIDDPCVSIGANQDLEVEVDVAAVKELGVDIVRRMTGGGAVYRDRGCIAFSVILPDRLRGEVARAVAEALRILGVDVVANDRNDLYLAQPYGVGQGKVCGMASMTSNDLALVHGSLLFSTDIETMERLLGKGKRVYENTPLASVRTRVADLQERLPGMDTESFRFAFEDKLVEVLLSYGVHVTDARRAVTQ